MRSADSAIYLRRMRRAIIAIDICLGQQGMAVQRAVEARGTDRAFRSDSFGKTGDGEAPQFFGAIEAMRRVPASHVAVAGACRAMGA